MANVTKLNANKIYLVMSDRFSLLMVKTATQMIPCYFIMSLNYVFCYCFNVTDTRDPQWQNLNIKVEEPSLHYPLI